jgi:hypothetical protein
MLSFIPPCRKCVSPRTDAAAIAAPGRQRTVRWWVGLALLLMGTAAFAEPASLKTIAILDFELIDDQQALAPATVDTSDSIRSASSCVKSSPRTVSTP